MSVPPLRRLAVAFVLALGLVAGCSSGGASEPSSNSGKTRVFAADNGDITIPVDPQRVVATGYAVPVLIEADAALVGISEWGRGVPMMTDEDLATYQKLDKIAGESADTTNYEAIAKANPDLIVIGVPAPVLADIDLKRLEMIAPVVAIGPSLPSAWRDLSKRQADAAGRLDNFETVKAAYEKKTAGFSDKYKDALEGVRFGHLGAYGDPSKGNFHREFGGSWGTNIAQDIGLTYYGEVAKKEGGSSDVSEYPSLEAIADSFADADAITYTLESDGSTADAVQTVLDSPLWQSLPAVKAGKVFALQYTEAATYASAMKTLDSIDAALAPLLSQ